MIWFELLKKKLWYALKSKKDTAIIIFIYQNNFYSTYIKKIYRNKIMNAAKRKTKLEKTKPINYYVKVVKLKLILYAFFECTIR